MSLKPKSLIFMFFIAIFLMGLFLANSINYMQNDDYMQYKIVGSFMKGNFTLDENIIATFYVQGLISALFALIFGLDKLPILTWIASFTNFLLIILIVYRFLKRGTFEGILCGLVYLLSPLITYSSFGFMTETYFNLFILLSFYFFFEFEENQKYNKLIFANILVILSYFIRQTGLLTSLTFSIFHFFNKRYKVAILELSLFIVLLAFHFYIFPQTQLMKVSNNDTVSLLNLSRNFNLVRIFLSYIGVFTFPYLIISILNFKSIRYLTISLFITLSLFFTTDKLFKPWTVETYSYTRTGVKNVEYLNTNFPYLENIFQRNGILPNNIVGERYHFIGFYDLFLALNILSNLSYYLIIFYLAYFLLNSRNKLYNSAFVFLIYSIMFLFMLLLAEKYYDRYLIPAITTFLLFLSSQTMKHKIVNYFLIIWIAIFGFITYQYTMEYHFRSRYIWNKSLELVAQGIQPNEIRAENSWIMLHNPNKEKMYKYTFAYNKDTDSQVVDIENIEYPFNFFIDSRIYLLKNEGSTL